MRTLLQYFQASTNQKDCSVYRNYVSVYSMSRINWLWESCCVWIFLSTRIVVTTMGSFDVENARPNEAQAKLCKNRQLFAIGIFKEQFVCVYATRASHSSIEVGVWF